MADAKHTVTYRGRKDGRRSGAYELDSNRKTWVFPRDTAVPDVPETVVKRLGQVAGHNFDIKKEG